MQQIGTHKPQTLPELIQQHFDGVLDTIESGRWGRWVLDRELLDQAELVLTHDGSGYTISVGGAHDWISVIAGKEWATADDVGHLVFAIRDLEYACWLGVLPGRDNAA